MYHNGAYDPPVRPYPFMDRAKQLVHDYIKTHVSTNDVYDQNDIHVIWFNKDGSDWAATLTAKIQPSVFYRVTHDSREKQTTIAVYNKFDLVTLKDETEY